MKSRPNVLFILADDQRFDTIHALGNSVIQTPNLDALAAQGTAFTEAHIPGGTSGAVCMPSRAMLNTGRSLFHIFREGQEIDPAHVTMGQCFRDGGYRTVGIGKWHNGTESYARSFCDGDNIFFGGMWDHWNVPVSSYHPDGKYENKVKSTPNFFYANHPMELVAEKIAAGKHSTELITDTALDFLRQKQEQPFFMYVSLLAPHDPRTMPEKYQNMYRPEDIQLPLNFQPDHPFFFGIGDESRDEALAAHPRGEAEVKQHICDYYAMISHIDDRVGDLIHCLEETGQLENTIIVYTGDNGLALGHHGLMGKQNCYDHSIHVPLIMAGPGISPNARSKEYVYLFDIYPTLCELCGLEIPCSVEGKSFLPILRDASEKSHRQDLYFAFTDLIRAVQDRRYKLIEYKCPRECSQLFDLQNDPLERKNLYEDPQYRAVKDALRKRMLEYQDQWEDDRENRFTKSYWENVFLKRTDGEK